MAAAASCGEMSAGPVGRKLFPTRPSGFARSAAATRPMSSLDGGALRPSPNGAMNMPTVYDRGEAKKIHVRKESRVDVYCVDGRHPANDLICHPMFARESRWVYGVRIPLAHPRHDFELRLLGGNGKQHHPVKQVGGVWRRVIGALNVDQGALQVSVVEQVADDDLRAGRAQHLGPLVLATDQGTNGKPALQ